MAWSRHQASVDRSRTVPSDETATWTNPDDTGSNRGHRNRTDYLVGRYAQPLGVFVQFQHRKRIDNLRTDVGKVRTEFQAGMKETRSDMNEMRAEFQAGMKEMRTDMNEMRADFQAGMNEMRADFQAGMKEMRADMKEMLKAIHEVSERVARLEEHKVMERGSGVVVGIPGQTMAPAPQRMRTSTP